MTNRLAQNLCEGAAKLGLTLTDTQITALLGYIEQLARWNGVYNLTAVRSPEQMLSHHLLDCLAVLPPLARILPAPTDRQDKSAARVLDVGAGGGLPGVVIAIMRPDLDVCCVDAVGKKAAFVQQVAAALRLPHLRGIHSRVEALKGAPFDVVTSRAFASLADFVRLTRFHVKPGGVWMALKGKQPMDEIAALPEGVAVLSIEPLQVPDLKEDRCLVWMAPTS